MQEEWFASQYGYDQENKWFEQAQIFSEQTDAMIFSITPEARTFNFIIEGKHIADVSAYNFLKFVKVYGFKQSQSQKRRIPDEIPGEKNISEQTTT